MVRIKCYSGLLRNGYLCLSPRITEKLSVNFCTQTTPKSTVDHDDVKNLNSLSHEWWNPNGSLKALHSMNVLRVPFIRDGLISTEAVDKSNLNTGKVLKDVKILEVGCGGGILTEPLARLHANVTGLDPGEDLLAVAKEHLAKNSSDLQSRVTYLGETVEDHAQANVGKYDAIVASEVLEHVTNKAAFLEACVLALRPGGSIFLTTLNRTNVSWLLGIQVAENILSLLPKNTHQWEKFITPEELERLLKDNNCSVSLTHGMTYEFWRNTWAWSECMDINFAMHAVKDD
ncbi:ubiquinone biosynthesis O-methyltransferase, mitochondrial [Culicoides brevitarsis]|uniref:ubiquinone biosynthesis O-methyltransferase, mitochondrial n=1 Tax=Culicoides brevitarsis TaxID=469753 RepID=UPI00307C8B57